MATIDERIGDDGNKTYRVRIRIKGSPSQSASFTRKTDAKRWAQVTEAAIREGRHFRSTESKRHTLSEAIARYKDEVLPRKSWKTAKDQYVQLAWWEKELGGHLLADVTTALISEKRHKLSMGLVKGKKRSPATVNRYVAALSHVFTIMTNEWEWIENSPIRKLTRLKETRGRVRFLSDDERKKLLKACEPNATLYAVVVLALSTGARQSELLQLTWKNVDLQRNRITFLDTKNGEIRSVPLQGLAFELVEKRSKDRSTNSDLVFPSRQSPNTPLSISSIFQRAVKQAKIEDFRFHDLRHSAASYLAMNGATLAEIAEVLGHKTLQMVKRYAHLTDQHTSSVVASMNEKIFQ